MLTSIRTQRPQPSEWLASTVQYLTGEAHLAAIDRRDHRREPFFRPVSVAVEHDEMVVRFSCFSRDISDGGIGLLHHMPLIPGNVIVTIYSESLGPVRIRCELLWCEACGDGWYTSGARFIDTLE